VSFQKKPDEGRMKGLAFIKDPDGNHYIHTIIETHTAASIARPFLCLTLFSLPVVCCVL
jgi:hypothetical protein